MTQKALTPPKDAPDVTVTSGTRAGPTIDEHALYSLVAAGLTCSQIATHCSVGLRTVYRWRQRPEYLAITAEACDGMRRAAHSRIT